VANLEPPIEPDAGWQWYRPELPWVLLIVHEALTSTQEPGVVALVLAILLVVASKR
jgi:hypothetical protein